MALTTVDNGLLSANSQYTGFKNRIINGAMVIDQRKAGVSASVTGIGYFSCDRWQQWASQSGKYSVQQSSTATTGFINSMVATSSSAYSVLSTDYFAFQQQIEGFNVADLAWGTVSASTVTLSFWVRSSLTGTFGGSLSNSAVNRSYPFTYTISTANTFEYKTPEDLIYYLLFTAEQLNLNPEIFKLEFLGNIAEDDAYFKIAYKYIRNVSLLDVKDLQENNSLATSENLKHFILLQS
jgi:hypothetical protein